MENFTPRISREEAQLIFNEMKSKKLSSNGFKPKISREEAQKLFDEIHGSERKENNKEQQPSWLSRLAKDPIEALANNPVTDEIINSRNQFTEGAKQAATGLSEFGQDFSNLPQTLLSSLSLGKLNIPKSDINFAKLYGAQENPEGLIDKAIREGFRELPAFLGSSPLTSGKYALKAAEKVVPAAETFGKYAGQKIGQGLSKIYPFGSKLSPTAARTLEAAERGAGSSYLKGEEPGESSLKGLELGGTQLGLEALGKGAGLTGKALYKGIQAASQAPLAKKLLDSISSDIGGKLPGELETFKTALGRYEKAEEKEANAWRENINIAKNKDKQVFKEHKNKVKIENKKIEKEAEKQSTTFDGIFTHKDTEKKKEVIQNLKEEARNKRLQEGDNLSEFFNYIKEKKNYYKDKKSDKYKEIVDDLDQIQKSDPRINLEKNTGTFYQGIFDLGKNINYLYGESKENRDILGNVIHKYKNAVNKTLDNKNAEDLKNAWNEANKASSEKYKTFHDLKDKNGKTIQTELSKIVKHYKKNPASVISPETFRKDFVPDLSGKSQEEGIDKFLKLEKITGSREVARKELIKSIFNYRNKQINGSEFLTTYEKLTDKMREYLFNEKQNTVLKSLENLKKANPDSISDLHVKRIINDTFLKIGRAAGSTATKIAPLRKHLEEDLIKKYSGNEVKKPDKVKSELYKNLGDAVKSYISSNQ